MPLNPWQELANSSPSRSRAPARRPKPRLNIWQQLANGIAPSSSKPKPKPKPKARTAPTRAPSYVADYAPAAAGRGGGSVVPALPGTAGAGGGAAPSAATSRQMLAQLQRQARQTVGMELDPQIRARQFARGEAQTSYNSQVAELKRRLGLTKTEIGQLYANLDVLLQATQARQQKALDTGKQQAGSAYDQLSTMLGSTYGQAGQDVSAELARIGQGGQDVTGRLAADKGFVEGQAATGRANATSTIDAIKAAAGSEGTQLRSSAAATAPMLQSQAQIAADDKQAGMKQELDSTIRQLNFQIRELSGSRRLKEAQLVRELQAAQAQAEQDAQQLNFLNQIRAAQLGISQGQLDLARTRLGYDVQNQQNSLVLRARELQARLAEKASKTAGPQTGMERAYSYLGSYRGRVPQTQLQAALEDAINGNSNDAGWSPGQGTPGYDPKYIDQYRRDIRMAVGQRGWSNAELNALLNAVGYYFKR